MDITKEDLANALSYLDQIQKGGASMPVQDVPETPAPGFDTSEKTNGNRDALKQKFTDRMNGHIEKAKAYKEKLDAIEKGEEVEDIEDEDEEKKVEKAGKAGEELPKKDAPDENMDKTEPGSAKSEVIKAEGGEPLNQPNQEELLKGLVENPLVKALVSQAAETISEKYETILKGKDDQLKEFSERLERVENTPIEKGIRKAAEGIALSKIQSGEPDDDGKQPISASFQKAKLADILFEKSEKATDSFEKSKWSDAVITFEASGQLNPSLAQELYEKDNIRVVQ